VVANNFQDFARAILRKLILEIAGRTPDTRQAGEGRARTNRLLVRVAAPAPRKAPPCDIGEQMRRQWWGDIDDDWYPGRPLPSPPRP